MRLQSPAPRQAWPAQVTRPAAATGGCEGGERLAPSCTPAVGRGHAEAAERCGNANLTRRAALGLLLAAGGAVEGVVRPRLASALEAAAGGVADAGDELAAFTNPGQGYRLLRPATWEQVDKAGADCLFRDPASKSTTLGVTVYPVTIASLEQFGDLAAVGERLLNAERAKESTLSVEMVEQRQRSSSSGSTIFDFEYELESTRGRKRILSTVTIADKKLFIANGSVSCSKESCSVGGGVLQLPLVRRATQSIATL